MRCLPSVARPPACSARNAERVGFVKQTQFAIRRFLRFRIKEHAAAHQRAMKIRHQRTDVTRAVTARFVRLHPVQVFLDVLREFAAVRAVDTVSLSGNRHLHIFLRQHERADGRIQREHMHAVTGRVSQHRAAAVKHVTGGNLLQTLLQNRRLHIAIGSIAVRRTFHDGENRADVDIRVDVAGAVERIEQNDVSAFVAGIRDHMRFFVFLRDQQADVAAITEAAHQRAVGDLVQLLHFLALDIHFARGAHDVRQAAARNLRGDDFAGEGDAGEQPAKLRGRVRIAPFAFQKMTFDCFDHRSVNHISIIRCFNLLLLREKAASPMPLARMGIEFMNL